MQEVPFDSDRWTWAADRTLGTVAGVKLLDGVIELELAVERERAFHGVVWRVQDEENFESSFVRPHQVFANDAGGVAFRAPVPPPVMPVEGIVPAWWVSDPFPENDPPLSATRTWTRLASEPTGHADLARVSGIRDGKSTVYARTTISSSRAQTKELAFGFSDRAVVSLNGRPLYRGNDTYR